MSTDRSRARGRRGASVLLGSVASVETWSVVAAITGTLAVALSWRGPILASVTGPQAAAGPTTGALALVVAVGGLPVLDRAVAATRGRRRSQARRVQRTLHNAVTLAVAATVTVLLATWFPPRAVAALLVAALAWDAVAAGLTPVTRRVLAASERLALPNHFVLPSDRRGADAVLGLADAVFPAVLALSVATTAGGSLRAAAACLAGACLAVPALRVAATRYDHVPALPFLNTGALAGYAVALLSGGW